jgi:hypothetical protein
MFDIKLMNDFRKETSDETEIQDDVKRAWFVFLEEFVIGVSYQWQHYLKDIGNGGNGSFRGILTASDEAFTMWLLTHKFDEVNNDAIAIKNTSFDLWKKTRTKRNVGTHDSKWKLDDFVDLHVKTKKQRAEAVSNGIWEQIFFKQLFLLRSQSSATREPDSTSKRSVNDSNLLDDQDEIEDEEL